MIDLLRIKNNHIGIYAVFVCILMGVLGLFLLVSLDGYRFTEISLGMLQYSIYTVYTQFGFFIFPVLSINFIAIDYKEKNVSFYELIGYNSSSYFLHKAFVLMAFITTGNIIISILLSIVYGDFGNMILFFFKLENVSIFITLMSLLYAYLFKNMMISYCFNFAIWVMSIVLYSINDLFRFLCFYDAALIRHSSFENILKSGGLMHASVLEEIIYNIIIFLFDVIVVYIFKRRWKRNGI